MIDVQSISRLQKDRFLRELSEDHFRDTVVRPLFLRLGFRDGRDLCGPTEAGKDTIFAERDKLGIEAIVAVQTKKGNLNLASSHSQNVVIAATQLKTALETPVAILGSRRAIKPSKVYLCASGRINDAAKTYILTEVANPNVTFLDADELIPRIDEHVPEVWLGINTDLLPYFDAIRRFIEGDITSNTAAGTHPMSGIFGVAASDTRFVTVNLFRPVARTRKLRGEVKRYTDFEEKPLNTLLEGKDRRVLIVGDAGAGKSTGLLRLAYTVAKQGIAEGNRYRIPVLVRSLDVYNSKPASLAEYCAKACQALTGRENACFSSEDLVSGRLIVLLDSLDELPSDAARSEVLELVEQMLKTYPNVLVIATSRPYSFTASLSQLRAYTEYRVSPISWRQAQKILRAVRTAERLSDGQSQELLRRLEHIHGIALNPLLVTVFAAASDYSKQDIPANITELFKKFTELMLGRWDEAKGLRQQYQAPLKDFVLTKLAFSMHIQNRTSLNRAEAESIVARELELRGYAADTTVLLNEVFDRSGLFRVDGDHIEFAHMLLQEFFAGRGIETLDQVRTLISDEWWKRALVFYFGENPDRIDLLTELLPSAAAHSGKDLMSAASTLGLALQACYLSPVRAKIDVWKWVVDALSVSMEEFGRAAYSDPRFPGLSFVHSYLYGRDSTALSHLKAHSNELFEWSKQIELTTSPRDPDRRLFWLISGLIESGELSTAEALLRKYRPADVRLLLGIHLGSYLTAKVRPVSKRDKQIANSIVERLNEPISGLRAQLAQEFETILLDMRDGRPIAIEHETEDPES